MDADGMVRQPGSARAEATLLRFAIYGISLPDLARLWFTSATWVTVSGDLPGDLRTSGFLRIYLSELPLYVQPPSRRQTVYLPATQKRGTPAATRSDRMRRSMTSRRGKT